MSITYQYLNKNGLHKHTHMHARNKNNNKTARVTKSTQRIQHVYTWRRLPAPTCAEPHQYSAVIE